MELNVTFFIQLGAFLVTVVLLSTMLFGPVLRALDERARRIDGAREEAARLSGTSHSQAGLIETRLKEARTAGLDEAARLKAEGERLEREELEKARQEAAKLVEEAKQRLGTATERARAQLNQDARNLASAVTRKVLGRAV